MNFFNTYPAKIMMSKIFISQYSLANILLPILPSNWCNHKGQNLYHLSALYQDESLFLLAKKNNADINYFDKNGKAPLHRLIEFGFTEKLKKSSSLNGKEHYQKLFFFIDWIKTHIISKSLKDDLKFQLCPEYEFLINIKLLKYFIESQCDVNIWIKLKESDTIQSLLPGNILGSPIELLIYLSSKYMSIPINIEDESYINYQKTYRLLTSAGANINLISKNKINVLDIQQDAMQISKTRIVSHNAAINVKNDLYILMPLLSDENLDFNIKDDSSNTFLHHLFTRITAKYDALSHEQVILALKFIYFNPAFNENVLTITNNLRIKPLECLKKEARVYAKNFENLILMGKLDNELTQKENKKIKVNKI